MYIRKTIIASAVVLVLANASSVMAEKIPFDNQPPIDSMPLIETAPSGFFVDAPISYNLSVMIVRVYDNQGELVLNVRSKGDPVELIAAGLPDGEYRYQVKTIYQLDTPVGEGPEYQTEGMNRDYGVFSIHNGEIEADTSPADEELGFIDTVSSNALTFIGKALSSIVPSAVAQNITIGSSVPTILWDDTTAGACCEWYTIGEGTATSGEYRIEDRIGSNINRVFSIAGAAGVTSNTDSIRIQSNGDILWAGGGMSFDRSLDELAIGINVTDPNAFAELTVSSLNPDIALLDESVGTMVNFQLANEEMIFWGRAAGFGAWGNIMNYNVNAPSDSLSIAANGDMGLGTGSPTEAVDVERSGAAARFQLTSFTNTGNQAAQFIQRRARGTESTPAAILNNDNIGLVSFRGYNGSAYTGSKAAIAVSARGNWTGSSNGTQIAFNTTPIGSTTMQNVMIITEDGQVRINGTALNVPDYVFEDDYDLMSLDDLAEYINLNKHLPGVANANEVNSNGLDLAGSQLSILEKVEELVLYTLQQHEDLKQLTHENAQLKASNREVLTAYHALKSEQIELRQMVNSIILNQSDSIELTSLE
ncbi:MAG: hypothetical protein L3J24_10430 [Xanthomonadales bacterium]|nr:hypothetical protein [Xanthomonadales bacterium]